MAAALAAEAELRAPRLGLGDAALLVRALASPASRDAPAGAAREALARRAERLLGAADGAPAEAPPAALAGLADALPHLREGRLQALLSPQIEAAAQQVLAAGRSGEVLREGAFEGELGAWGTGLLLRALGVARCPPGFAARALSRVVWASAGAEDRGLQTTPHRRFAFTEYRLGACEGSLVTHDGPRAPDSALGLHKAVVACDQVKAAEYSALCWALCDLSQRAAEAAGVGADAAACFGVCGQANIFLTWPPSAADLVGLRRFQLTMPRVTLAVSIVGDGGEADPEPGSAGDDDDEVLDCELPGGEEVMEAVD